MKASLLTLYAPILGIRVLAAAVEMSGTTFSLSGSWVSFGGLLDEKGVGEEIGLEADGEFFGREIELSAAGTA